MTLLGFLMLGSAWQWTYMLHGATPSLDRFILFYGPPTSLILWGLWWFAADVERQRRELRDETGRG